MNIITNHRVDSLARSQRSKIKDTVYICKCFPQRHYNSNKHN